MQALLKAHPVPIDKSRIRLSSDDLLKILGEQQDNVDSFTSGLVEQYISECLRISSPEGAFIHTKALAPESPDIIRIPGMAFQTGNIIQKMLQHAENYAFLLVTAGPEPEQLARSLLNEGKFLEGYIVDLVASDLVDKVADQVQEHLKCLAEKQGQRITNRYSPGYCSWNVAEQQKLFSLFPDGCCGISLTESSLMDPIKSLSAIIGVGTKVSYNDYTCEFCPMLKCQFRRVRDQ